VSLFYKQRGDNPVMRAEGAKGYRHEEKSKDV
jgi:hypothetical protein